MSDDGSTNAKDAEVGRAMPDEVHLPPLAKPARLRIVTRPKPPLAESEEESRGEVFFESQDGSDTADLTKLLKPAATMPPAPVSDASGTDLPDGSLADILRIPVAGAAELPPEAATETTEAEEKVPELPSPPATKQSFSAWLKEHPLIWLTMLAAALIMGGVYWWEVRSYHGQTIPGEGAKRPPPRHRDIGAQFEDMSIEKMRQFTPQEVEMLRELIVTAEQAANWSRVVTLSDKALSAELGESCELWRSLGRGRNALGQEDQAILAFQKAYQSGARDQDVIMALAQYALEQGDQSRAGFLLTEAARLFPNDKEILLLAGQVSLALGQEREALSAWRRLSEVDFPEDLLRQHLGLLRRQGDLAEAYRFQLFAARQHRQYDDYWAAAELAPDVGQRSFVLAEAAGIFRDNPERDALALMRAETMLDLGDRGGAAMLLKSLRMAELPVALLPRLAKAVVSTGDADALQDVWQEIRRRYPNDLELHCQLAEMIEQTGGRHLVRNFYGRWAGEEPDRSLPQYIFGLAVEDDQLALASFDKALALNPNFHEAASAAAELCQRQGDQERAERYYLVALRARPDDRQSHLGLALNNIGRDGEQAFRRYEEFLDRQRIAKADSLPELLMLAQHLPAPVVAEAVLAEMAQIPALAEEHRRQAIRTRLIYQQLGDQDFAGAYPRELREYHILYLLGQGRLREVLMMPTPKEDFPEFWKVFLCWRQGIDIWRENARELRQKHRGDPLIEVATGLWSRTLSPDDAVAMLPRVPIEQKPLLVMMIAERWRQEGNRTRSRIEYLRAIRLAGVSPYTQVIRWFSEN